MLRGEHSAIPSTFIKLPFVIKIFVLSIFKWPIYPGVTVVSYQKGLYKQSRPRIRVFHVCYSDNHFVNSSPANKHFIDFFDLILYVPVYNLSVMSGWVFLGWTCTKQGSMCLAQRHNTLTPVRLKPVASRSPVKHSITEPLCSLTFYLRTEKKCS